MQFFFVVKLDNLGQNGSDLHLSVVHLKSVDKNRILFVVIFWQLYWNWSALIVYNES